MSKSQTITEPEVGGQARIRTHPGEVLREEFMVPLGVSINALSRSLDIPLSRASGLVNENRAVTPETALRLAAWSGTSPEFWMNLQIAYDLSVASAARSAEIRATVRPLALP